jgi:hypothetical protein
MSVILLCLFSAVVSLLSLVSHVEGLENGHIPIGVNLSPIGLNAYTLGYSGLNWAPVSTYVFIDLYKHCSPLYIRSVWIHSFSFFLSFFLSPFNIYYQL